MKRLFFSICLTSFLMTSLVIHADEKKGDAQPKYKGESTEKSFENQQDSRGLPGESQSEVAYEKKTFLDFGDATLEGELTRPEGSYVLNRQRAKFGSLLEIRENFTPELEKSVDEF